MNLQKTPYDDLAAVRIFAKTDLFMQELMKELGITDFNQDKDILDTWDNLREVRSILL